MAGSLAVPHRNRGSRAPAGGLPGEHDDLRAAGLGACYVLSTCELLLDFVRARQWYERALEWAGSHDLAASGTFCRSHFCKVLLWHGEWEGVHNRVPEPVPPGGVKVAALE
jgi:hypothetical protein